MNKLSILQFAMARGIGELTLKNAFAYIRSQGIEWDVFVETPAAMQAFGLSSSKIQSILETREKALAIQEKLDARDIRVLTENDEDYPQYLRYRLGNKCPPILFAEGNVDLLRHSAVGFCGSRKASDKGLWIAANCAEQLVNADLTVVSGYAAGTDLAVHKSALEHHGNTVFVLPEGILRAAKKSPVRPFLTSENHVFVSQFAPNAAWSAFNAMKRNSVVVGLSRAMILVESRLRGGTFAAGEEALRVGCPLFVVDYAKPAATAEANPYFIERGGERIRGTKGIPNMTRVKEIVAEPSPALMGSASPETVSATQLSFM